MCRRLIHTPCWRRMRFDCSDGRGLHSPIPRVLKNTQRDFFSMQIKYNRPLTLFPAFSEPQSHCPRAIPPPALGESGRECRAAGASPRGNLSISPHPRRIGPHLWFRNPPIHPQLRQPRDENGDPPSGNRPAWCGNPRPTGRSLAGDRS